MGNVCPQLSRSALLLAAETGRCILALQVFKQPWPGIMHTVYGNHERFETTYFKKFPGYYCTGDGLYWWTDSFIGVVVRFIIIGLYHDVWIAAIARSRTSLATQTAVICACFHR